MKCLHGRDGHDLTNKTYESYFTLTRAELKGHIAEKAAPRERHLANVGAAFVASYSGETATGVVVAVRRVDIIPA